MVGEVLQDYGFVVFIDTERENKMFINMDPFEKLQWCSQILVPMRISLHF